MTKSHQMSSKSKGTGLRILWIPGKRSTHRKGNYKTTNASPNYSGKQKPNEMWSLGGSKGQRDLLKSNDDGGVGDLDVASGSILPSVSAVGGAVASTAVDIIPPQENGAVPKKVQEQSSEEASDDYADDYNAAATLKLKNKKTDYDSIERLDDSELADPKVDVADGPAKRRLRKTAPRRELEVLDEEKKDDKFITCLYYSLMCCECSIS